MPILDSIKIAEAKAEELRRQATETVRLLMDETKEKSDLIVTKMMEDAANEDKHINLIAQEAIEAKRIEIMARVEMLDVKQAESAKQKEQQAVEFIIKKVIEL
ncbi:MAG: hypothetical protein WC479_07170 [Candidatus Izemoplasmatales bacterium]|jgi:vacuolar-type H+-ATPase subunit H|nr:hypothetical protein [Candidatus Izemoplasmatales bacterium]MDD3865119.1 hypothetical protein [Candidatus Izemoplasmatales bacterium]